LTGPIRELEGLAHLAGLRKLRLGGPSKLASLHGVEELYNMTELKVQTCRRINSIEPIRGLLHLRRLILENLGDIDSLGPVAGLSELELLTFAESTNILDGDLSYLKGLHNLKTVSFQNRRHYSSRREEFPQQSVRSYSSP
jgi:hypothetical protein